MKGVNESDIKANWDKALYIPRQSTHFKFITGFQSSYKFQGFEAFPIIRT